MPDIDLDKELDDAQDSWRYEVGKDFIRWGGLLFTTSSEHDEDCLCWMCVTVASFWEFRETGEEPYP